MVSGRSSALAKASICDAASEQNESADRVEAQPRNQSDSPVRVASEEENRNRTEQEKEVEVPPDRGFSLAHTADLLSATTDVANSAIECPQRVASRRSNYPLRPSQNVRFRAESRPELVGRLERLLLTTRADIRGDPAGVRFQRESRRSSYGWNCPLCGRVL